MLLDLSTIPLIGTQFTVIEVMKCINVVFGKGSQRVQLLLNR